MWPFKKKPVEPASAPIKHPFLLFEVIDNEVYVRVGWPSDGKNEYAHQMAGLVFMVSSGNTLESLKQCIHSFGLQGGAQIAFNAIRSIEDMFWQANLNRNRGILVPPGEVFG